MSANAQVPSHKQWEAVNLSLIAFPHNPKQASADWWTDLTGEQPEEVLQKRHEKTVDGEYNGYGLKLEIEPVRIVWTAGPLTRIVAQSLGGVPTFGTYPDARDDFATLMKSWLTKSCPPIHRIAFVGHLFCPHPTKQDSYQALNEHLRPWVKVDPNSSDFEYRINRKRQSGTCNLLINRLQTWSVMRISVSAQMVGASQPIADAYGCLLQFDINTPAQDSVLDHNSLPAIFDELVSLATEIAMDGDVP